MSFSRFQDFWLRLYLSKNFQKNHEIDLIGFFRRRFLSDCATCGVDGSSNHALYFPSPARLCGWNWGSDCGSLRLYDQLLWTPNRWELWISVLFLICLFIIGAWLSRCTTIFSGGWQFGSYRNSLGQMVSWEGWSFSYQLLPSWLVSSPCLLVVF